MLDSEQLQSLYEQGNYKQCLEELNLLLLFNTHDTTALLLKGKCLYQVALNEIQSGNEANFTFAANCFEEVLSLSPSHEEAMTFAAYINIFITQGDLPAAIGYCSRLLTSANPITRANALRYRQEAYSLTGKFDLVLKDLETLAELIREIHQNNLPALDQESGDLYFRKGIIHLENFADHSKALEAFREVLKHGHADFSAYCRIAEVALDQGDYETGGEAAVLAFFTDSPDPGNERLTLYHLMEALNKKGIHHPSLVKAMFIGQRIFADAVGADTTELLSFARQYIQMYPDWFWAWHYAGAALYDAENYEAALPYLAKSLELGGTAIGLQRYIETAYHVNGELPLITKWPEDLPMFYYNAGVNFNEFEASLAGTPIAPELLKIRTGFYRMSYDGFYDYFYNNNGKAGFSESHIFAMCCNNYGIALTDGGTYDKAADVHRLGYSISPFWEQSNSLGTALMLLGKYEEAIAAFARALDDGGQYLDFADYIELKGEILTALSNLGRTEELTALLQRTEEEYNDFIAEHGSGLSAEERFILSERYITVQNARHDLLSGGSIEDAVRAWQEQLEKHPDDNSAWYMLMQNYFQLKDYQQCIACANNYLSVKAEAIKPESLLKVHFMRGVSYLRIEKYGQAKAELIMVLKGCDPADESGRVSICDANMHLAKCSAMLQQWEECKTYAWDAITCYNDNGWKWDDTCFATALHYADACMATGEKKAAIGTVDVVLGMAPNNEDALSRKKEWKSGGLFSFLKKK
ncbi:tetratricopeptide repeat protein [Chitinophaga niabensis]|uniref:Tetratricopeptide repeat-containing protein n=1 Tax=Chitinophaga niabensis TaxID=536979 RepID=A0A1N6D3Y5_9BACT|nr:tetratricopeptide repeat protein [Chitinophaga niabensis]SIN65495.1 Tetratricopeptide repeat-containing protein [Chitinophaga niabensis]